MYTASACVGGVQSAIARSAGASQSSAGRASQSQAVAVASQSQSQTDHDGALYRRGVVD